MATVYRPEFEAALRMFAQASGRMVAQGFEAPILVGGGSVEFFSASALTTGDFDIATARQEEFEAALRELGFVKPSGPAVRREDGYTLTWRWASKSFREPC